MPYDSPELLYPAELTPFQPHIATMNFQGSYEWLWDGADFAGTESLSITLTDTEPHSITVPAGTFDAWPIERSITRTLTSGSRETICVEETLAWIADGIGVIKPEDTSYWTGDYQDPTAEHSIELADYSISVTPLDLGQLDFRRVDSLNPAHGQLWFRLETTHDGWLTVLPAGEQTTNELTLSLFDPENLREPVATSREVNGKPRFDWEVTSGQAYLIRVTGSASDVTLLMANLVYESGTSVTVYGTAEADEFIFDPAASRIITINGVPYYYEDSQVSTVDFDGGEGRDIAWLYDTDGNETVEAWPRRAVFVNAGDDDVEDFTVEVIGADDLQAYATRGGIDSAVFHGSADADKLKSYEESLRLRGRDSNYTLRAKKYDTIVGDPGTGGKDVAVFNGSDHDETFTYVGVDNSARMESTDRDHLAVGFAYVTARAGKGENDVAHFTDIPGPADVVEDVFYFKSHKTQLVGANVKITARTFDEVHATASETGFDVARIYDTSGDDLLEVEGNTARLYRYVESELDLLYEAVAFERVKTYSTEGDDTTDIQDHTIDLILNGWDE